MRINGKYFDIRLNHREFIKRVFAGEPFERTGRDFFQVLTMDLIDREGNLTEDGVALAKELTRPPTAAEEAEHRAICESNARNNEYWRKHYFGD